MKKDNKTKLAPTSKNKMRKLIAFTKEVSKAIREGGKYIDRDDIKIN